MSGRLANVAASISMPVESSQPVFGHFTMSMLARFILFPSSGGRVSFDRLAQCVKKNASTFTALIA